MSDLQYELWDMDTANRLAVFASRQAAMDLVRQILRESGDEAVQSLGLGLVQPDADGVDDLEPLLDGDELLAEARQAITTFGERVS
jgi:hypothetical protein